MMQELYDACIYLFGQSRDIPTLFQLSARFVFVYTLGLILTRVNRRFIGIRTSFNFILFILLGSVFAGAITGNSPFYETMASAVMIMMVNWFLSALVYYFPGFEKMIKGERYVLIKNGEIQWHMLRRNYISYSELTDAIHEKGGTTDMRKVKHAFFEQDGAISIILYKDD